MIALRGATTISENSVEEIKKSTVELFNEMIMRNDIDLDKILTIEFSCTKDITKAYPGKFVREAFNVKHAAIMHFNEMYVEGETDSSLPLCIRILMLVDVTKIDKEFVYLKNAKNLRSDLFSK
ncbi:chorismate mutase [Clostridium sp. A1-XYC3]|uniref:chorismate mutase n=1 Tax=Clostridium tanneri TaxID=3037988 RepID=A0ABU4JUW9_9CLOT|nr:chorismate mutase [Clostridium sp. A1-XYC3]MDW8801945.1 chorismate mutase [Clostridium sp. A1-XYC3]